MRRAKQIALAERELFCSRQSKDELPRVLERLLSLDTHHIRAQVLLSESDAIVSFLAAFKDHRTLFKSSVVVEEADYLSVSLAGEVGGKNKRPLSGRFLLLPHPSISLAWVLVLRDDSEFERRLLDRFIKKVRPRLTRPLLSSAQLRELFEEIARSQGVTGFRLTEIGKRSMIHSKGASKAVEADRRWTDVTISEAFDEAKESGSWVVDVTGGFDYRSAVGVGLKVTRQGVITYRKLVSSMFWTVVDRVAGMGAMRYEFLNGRARAPENKFYSKPFSVRFGPNALETREDLERLVGALDNIPHVTFTPMHVNPYYHAAMLDYHDGSSYDVYVLDDNDLTIVPQGRATVQALQRLCEKVFSDFREGVLEEVSNGG